MLSSLGFQLLLSGTSEEILFRALPITVFGTFECRKEKNDYKLAIIIASMLFSIAHIKWTILPFAVSLSWFQLIYAFVLGLIYAVTYIKSKSIIYGWSRIYVCNYDGIKSNSTNKQIWKYL